MIKLLDTFSGVGGFHLLEGQPKIIVVISTKFGLTVYNGNGILTIIKNII